MVQLISQTAIQEFKVGSAERGRSMFESCLRNYPARLDVWSQYLDQACAFPPLPSPPKSPQASSCTNCCTTFAGCADSFVDAQFPFCSLWDWMVRPLALAFTLAIALNVFFPR